MWGHNCHHCGGTFDTILSWPILGEYSLQQEQDVSNETPQRKTLTVPEAGELYFGLGRDAAYAAARRGDIPVIRLGRSVRVPIAALERLMLDPDQRKSSDAA